MPDLSTSGLSKSVIEKVITTILVGALLGLATLLYNWASDGGLVRVMGGVAKVDMTAAIEDAMETAKTARTQEIAALQAELDRTKAQHASTEAQLAAADATVNDLGAELARLKSDLSAIKGVFDGAARIAYFSDYLGICAHFGCPTPLPSGAEEQAPISMTALGKRTYEFQVEEPEPFTILTSWYEIEENTFVASGGDTATLDITLAPKDKRLRLTVEGGPPDGLEAFISLRIHYLIAMQDSARLIVD